MNRLVRAFPHIRRVFDTCAIAIALASGFDLLDWPHAAMTVIAFYALFVVPGASLRQLFFPATEGAVARAAEAFVLGVVFVSAVVCAGFIPGVSYGAISIVAAVAAVVIVWLPSRREAGTSGNLIERDRAPGSGASIISCLLVVAAVVGCFFALFGRGELGWSTDALDHVSFVRRSVESGALFPRDSFYREGDGVTIDPRKGLWHPALSLWVRESGAAADYVWRMVPSLVVFFAVCVFHRFAAAITGAGWSAWLAAVLLVFFAAGEGPAWFAKIGFSRNMALVLYWAWMTSVVRWCVRRRRGDLAAMCLVAAAGTAFHVAFALYVSVSIVAVILYVLLAAEGKRWRRAFAAAGASSAASACVSLLPRLREAGAAHNAIHTHLQGMLRISDNLAVVDLAEAATRLGLVFFLAIAIAPFFLALTRERERRGLVLALFIVPVLVVFDPLTGAFLERRIGYLHYRILDAAPTAVFMALSIAGLVRVAVAGAGVSRRGTGSSGRRIAATLPARVAAVAALALFVAYPLRVAVRQTGNAMARAARPVEIPAPYESLLRTLNERIPAHSVIVSDPRTSYVVSAFTDHYVVVVLDQHGSPSDTLALERLRSTRDLLSPAVPVASSAAWLAGTGADFVLVNETPSDAFDFFETMPPGGARAAIAKLDACPSLFEPAMRLDGFSLYRVRRITAGETLPAACDATVEPPPVCATGRDSSAFASEDEALVVESEFDVGSGIALAGLVIDRYTLRNIDTLTGRFCWRATRPVPYGLPLEVVLRFDSDFPKGHLFREWYGKQYRRVVERRERRFYRFTWTERLRSGSAQPDLWPAGEEMRQDFAIPLPWSLAPGAYEVRVLARRVPYLPVRIPADYLSNEDSQEGVPVGMVYVQ